MESVFRRDVPVPAHEVPVKPEDALLATTDGRYTFIATRADNVSRLVTPDGTELLRGSGPLTGSLDGTTLIATEVVADGVVVSIKDLVTGEQHSQRLDYDAAQVVSVAGGNVLLQEDVHCTSFVNLATMAMSMEVCDETSSATTLVTAESDGLHWHETKADGTCGGWFRLGRDGTREQLNTTEAGCKANAYVRSNGWDVTAHNSLTAHHGNREILLDTAKTTDLHPCGDHIYWLSQPNQGAQPNLTRWRPGENTVERISHAQSPKCVNNVLSFVTINKKPHLWTLPNP